MMKRKLILSLLLTVVLFGTSVQQAKALPLSGAYFIDNTLTTGGTNFANFTDAVASLNTNGVSGPVVFNVAAGQSWSLTCAASPNNYGLKITAIGSAANTITFIKSGFGANPILSITGTSATNDMGVWLSGTSYVTFDGIDITDAGTAAATFLDYGFYLKGASTTVGCISNTYQNGTITLHRTNTTAYGVFVDGSANTAGTAQNKYNKFYNNTIINAFNGYRLNGYTNTAFNLRDLGTEIGTINGGRSQIIGTGSTSVATLSYGIFSQHQDSAKFFNTLVDTVQTSVTSFPGATGIYCISNSNTSVYNDTMRNITGPVQAVGLNFENETGVNNIYNNLIEKVTLTGTTAGSLNVMRLYGSYTTIGTTFQLNVYNNIIRNCGSAASASPVEGMYLGSLAGTNMLVNCYNNQIYGLYINYAAAHTTTVEGIFLNSTPTFNIYNNVISDFVNPYSTASPGVRGFTVSGGTTVAANLYNNTVYFDPGNAQVSTNTSFTSACLFSATATNNINLRNNVFVNKNTISFGARVTAIYWTGTSYATLAATSNNNLYYGGTPGTKNLLFYDGTNAVQTLAAYKTLMVTKEQYSYTEDVPFVNGTTSPFDLHVSTATPTQVESSGGVIATVLTDIDGNTRNVVTPDLGASEFSGTLLDLTPPVISYTPLSNNAATGNKTLTATITDISGVPTSGAGLPVLYWKINSGSYSSATGTFVSANTYNFLFGAGANPSDIVSYYIVAQDNASTVNIGSFPTTWSSSFFSNPPYVTTPPSTVSSYMQLGTLAAGTYAVGVGNTYPTLTSAISAYNNLTLGGPVVFELTDATYPSETYPITIGANPSASVTATLTIRPNSSTASAISFSASNATAIFDLNGANYVTIDGRPGGVGTSEFINIQNTSTTANAVLIRNEASNNKLTYLNVSSANVNAAVITAATTIGTIPGAIAIGTTTGANGNDNNTISFCDVHSTGTTLTVCIYAGNATTAGAAANNDNNTITDCNLYDFFHATLASMAIDIAVGNNSFTINNNKLYQTANRTYTSTQTVRGMWIAPYSSTVTTAGSGFVINGNTIGYATSTGTGFYTMAGTSAWLFWGFDLTMGLGTATSVQNNTITSITISSNGGTGSTSFVGLQVNNGNVNLAANTIGSATTNGAISFNATTTNSGFIGIRIGAGGTINITNNTISGITITASAVSIIPIFNGIAASGGTLVNILNNTIGSGTLAQSINLPTACTAVTIQSVRGIIANGATTVTIIGNLIANMNTNIVSTGTQANVVVGIVVSAGTGTVNNNTIRNLYSASQTTGAGANSCIQGIQYNITSTSSSSVNNNRIYNLISSAPTTAVQVVGIFYAGPPTGINTVANNRVYGNMIVSSSTTAAMYGIQLTSGAPVVSNNVISLGSDTLGNSLINSLDIRGIYEAAGASNLYFNSVYISGVGVANTTSTYAFYTGVAAGSRRYRNNAFVNMRSYALSPTTSVANYAALISGTLSAGAITGVYSNYNLYYANGVGGAIIQNGVGGTVYATLSSWKIVATGHDTNSVSGDPMFTSVEMLRALPGSALVNGDPLTGITTDIAGNTRVNNLMGAYDSYNPLPVKLLTFVARKSEKDVELNWITASEINNDRFVIQRSVDGNNWTAIGSVKGFGTTNTSRHYQFTDNGILENNNTVYYRLQQIDMDGKFEYSPIVLVTDNQTAQTELSVMPNPTTGNFTIYNASQNMNNARVIITDMLGKTVYDATISNDGYDYDVDVNSLNTGTYIITIHSAEQTSRLKFVKQ